MAKCLSCGATYEPTFAAFHRCASCTQAREARVESEKQTRAVEAAARESERRHREAEIAADLRAAEQASLLRAQAEEARQMRADLAEKESAEQARRDRTHPCGWCGAPVEFSALADAQRLHSLCDVQPTSHTRDMVCPNPSFQQAAQEAGPLATTLGGSLASGISPYCSPRCERDARQEGRSAEEDSRRVRDTIRAAVQRAREEVDWDSRQQRYSEAVEAVRDRKRALEVETRRLQLELELRKSARSIIKALRHPATSPRIRLATGFFFLLVALLFSARASGSVAVTGLLIVVLSLALVVSATLVWEEIAVVHNFRPLIADEVKASIEPSVALLNRHFSASIQDDTVSFGAPRWLQGPLRDVGAVGDGSKPIGVGIFGTSRWSSAAGRALARGALASAPITVVLVAVVALTALPPGDVTLRFQAACEEGAAVCLAGRVTECPRSRQSLVPFYIIHLERCRGTYQVGLWGYSIPLMLFGLGGVVHRRASSTGLREELATSRQQHGVAWGISGVPLLEMDSGQDQAPGVEGRHRAYGAAWLILLLVAWMLSFCVGASPDSRVAAQNPSEGQSAEQQPSAPALADDRMLATWRRECRGGKISSCHRALRIDTVRSGLNEERLSALAQMCTSGVGDACRDIALMTSNIGHLWREGVEDVRAANELNRWLLGFGAQAHQGTPGRTCDGRTMPSFSPEGMSWLQRGCAFGSGQACNTLGAVLERGDDVERAPSLALRVYRKACELDLGVPCLNAARLAADQGDPAASELLEKAQAALDRSCEQGDAGSCAHLGRLLAMDTPGGGRPLLERACRMGERAACDDVDLIFGSPDEPDWGCDGEAFESCPASPQERAAKCHRVTCLGGLYGWRACAE